MYLSVLLHAMQPLSDGGYPYRETDLSQTIAEPWNAISSLLFLIPVVYWAYKLRGRYHQHWFLSLALPLLFLGGIGSALFHAFRVSPWLLWLDVAPILVLTMALSVYFWLNVTKRWEYAAGIITVFLIVQYLNSTYIGGHTATNISYFLRGTVMFLPAVMLMYQSKFRHAPYLLFAIGSFILALVFRYIDVYVHISWMPMGTHWLWHTATAVGAWLLGEYVYHTDLQFNARKRIRSQGKIHLKKSKVLVNQ
ncbi:ceramidase domain-containing protein [Eisenibacter elegans]|uniref:ceramidase domain-containing protein n=1 Tax=Eisenibacter elegans TaxID=997 RepID=UPI000414FC63|nr:ceramidase domain-containing protein [Eisenibacter elegans]